MLLQRLHHDHVHARRVRRLRDLILDLLPDAGSLVDVGAGDGWLAAELQRARPELCVDGVDVLVRPQTHIPVQPFDGHTLPLDDRSRDVVLLIDVLHHTDDPEELLAEAARVARRAVILKDHCRDDFLARPTLRFMDWVSNASYGVALPYNYWTRRQWRQAFARLGLTVDAWHDQLGLYPWPADWIFGRGLHVLARLVPQAG
jgi:SAM-dependent methyltransferase